MPILDKIFGTHSDRELKKITPLVDAIMDLDEKMQAMSDEELFGMTAKFKERLAAGETLDDILVDAFAVVREADARVLGLKPFRVQVIGGIILHQGRLAEMKTGEGKTLVSTMPAYLNALEGKGVHIVTVNDYLANRDATEMGQVHKALGLTVGCILNSSTPDERREAYNSDITYITNNELGFDYLRDNMVVYKKNLVQRGLHFAIIDEIDSILIDEARTPLIISGQSGKSTDIYKRCDYLARQMTRGTASTEISKRDILMGEAPKEDGDYLVNEKDKYVVFTEQGIKQIEEFFGFDNFSDSSHLEYQHTMLQAVKAHALMHKDQDYIVKDGEILIVDEFTGRVMPGRRFSDGLHQCIEAKEHVDVKRESRTLATITFQNFFNKYEKKCGMTGTALTEENEFRDIYGMDVVVVPTNLPVKRIDHDDAIYKTKKEKLNAIVDEILASYEKGQPVLVGTVNIDSSEEISAMLNKRGLKGKHQVLNAKYHEMEAQIVAEAGQPHAVTIATNMAGRGTDIKLGEGVAELGGLKIIGTERHESRRIDNQLRGRSGRQGDPGESKFYISLEDDLMRLFGSDRMMAVFDALRVPEGQEIQHKALTKAVERAQQKIEGNNFAIRKNLLEYDQVNNEQREVIYAERRRVLDNDDMHETIIDMAHETIDRYIDMCCSQDTKSDEWDMQELNDMLCRIITFPGIKLTEEEEQNSDVEHLRERLKAEADEILERQLGEFPEDEMRREVERRSVLRGVDVKWMEHIDDMEQLRQGIGLQSMGGKDPVVEYKLAAFDMFNDMLDSIKETTTQMVYHTRYVPNKEVEREQVAKATGTNKDDTAKKKSVVKSKKIYPNDKCPCGSGKKYKDCCGKFK